MQNILSVYYYNFVTSSLFSVFGFCNKRTNLLIFFFTCNFLVTGKVNKAFLLILLILLISLISFYLFYFFCFYNFRSLNKFKKITMFFTMSSCSIILARILKVYKRTITTLKNFKEVIWPTLTRVLDNSRKVIFILKSFLFKTSTRVVHKLGEFIFTKKIGNMIHNTKKIFRITNYQNNYGFF